MIDGGLDNQINACASELDEDGISEDITDIDANLFAIASYQKNGINYVNYIYSDADNMCIDDIKDELNYSIEETDELTESKSTVFDSANAGATGAGHYVHTKTQTLRGKSGWNALKVSTSVEMWRKSKSTVINGKTGSVWDVVARSSFETSGKYRVGNTYSRLSIADFSNQKLLDWGPTGTNSGNVSFSLSGSGPSVSYSFSTGNRIKSLSSQSGKYGRWNMTSTSHRKTMTYKPGIRYTNTSGPVAIDVSHSAMHYIPSGMGYQVGTGVWRIYSADRT